MKKLLNGLHEPGETETASAPERDEFLSYVDAGAVLRVCPRTIHNYVKSGRLHAISINSRKKLIRRSVLQQFLLQAEAGFLPPAQEPDAAQLTLNI